MASVEHATVEPFSLDRETLLSLGVAFSLMPTAQFLASRYLSKSIPRTYYFLFIWHAYDALTHFVLEGSYLYHCFFSYKVLAAPSASTSHPASWGADLPPVLWNNHGRKYGAWYGSGPMARLWQEYAKADTRWGGADPTVISLELLTVFLGGPIATYICYLLSKFSKSPAGPYKARLEAKMWVVAIMLATGELYGGWMTFAPEWISGCTALRTQDPVFLWLYLFFFNTLWVFIPIWILWKAYGELARLVSGDGAKKTT